MKKKGIMMSDPSFIKNNDMESGHVVLVEIPKHQIKLNNDCIKSITDLIPNFYKIDDLDGLSKISKDNFNISYIPKCKLVEFCTKNSVFNIKVEKEYELHEISQNAIDWINFHLMQYVTSKLDLTDPLMYGNVKFEFNSHEYECLNFEYYLNLAHRLAKNKVNKNRVFIYL